MSGDRSLVKLLVGIAALVILFGVCINPVFAAASEVTVKGDVVNVRSGPSTNDEVIAKVYRNQKLDLIDKSGDWFNVRIADGETGWIAAWLVEVRESSAVKSLTKDGDESLGWIDAWKHLNKQAKTKKSEETDKMTVKPSSGVVLVNTEILNIRTGPGTNYDLAGKVSYGEKLTVLGEKGTWFKVALPNNDEGWVAGWLVTKETPELPDNDTKATQPVQRENEYLLVKGSAVNVRSGPGTNYDIKGKVYVGERLTVLKQDGDWYMVKYSGNEQGWIAGWLTETYSLNSPSRNGSPLRDDVNPSNPPETSSEPEPVSEEESEDEESEDANLLKSIKFKDRVNGEEEIVIESEGEIEYNLIRLRDPARLVIDLDNADIGDLEDFKADGKLVSEVRVAQYTLDPMVVRVVLDLSRPVGYKALLEDENTELIIKMTEPSIEDKTIVIDPGHGGYDPGAIGVTGLKEKEVNLKISLLVEDKLENLGANVVLTRDDDKFISLYERARIANDSQADVFVSIHANASTNPEKNGTSTYYYAPSSISGLYSQKGDRTRLARVVQSNLVDSIKIHDIGIMQENFAVLRETHMPSVLVETAFLSNEGDESLLKDEDFLEKAAQGIVDGLVEFFSE